MFGMNIMAATHSANKAANNTDPALISLTIPAFLPHSGWTMSTRYSMAVLNASAIQTSAIAVMIHSHSPLEIPNTNPAMVTRMVATK